MLEGLLSLPYSSLSPSPSVPLHPSLPVVVEFHAHLLDALGPFLHYSPPAAAAAMRKLFSLLQALPPSPLVRK